MLKKVIISAMLSAALFAGVPASASMVAAPETEAVELTEKSECCAEVTESANQEVAAVQQSEATRLERQAEKARNAAENDKSGGAITIIAMCIVLGALVILSLLFLAFGKISSSLHTRNKRKSHGVTDATAESHHDELDSGEAIAAISMALAEHMGQGHDMEDTILTIRRMRKAYSPWNSKIYNLRVTPQVAQHPRRKL
jgi:Na+-transporting methylmalonyl-CoA/oxaloacetate decarboxylase gamma subunit